MVKWPSDSFYIQKMLYEEEDLETEVNLSDKFQVGRVGDHLMGIPFEKENSIPNKSGRQKRLVQHQQSK